MMKKAREMRIDINFCKKCLDRLSPRVRSTYIFLCHHFVKNIDETNGLLVYEDIDRFVNLRMRQLENKGFLVTTETEENFMLLKINGHELQCEQETESHYFCLSPHLHLVNK